MSSTKLVPGLVVSFILRAALVTVAFSTAVPVSAQEGTAVQKILGMPWQANGKGYIGGVATIEASPQARFLSPDDSPRFIELSGNPPEEDAAILAPKDLHWFSVYRFSDVGYVSDKDAIDANDLMTKLKDAEPAQNAERRKLGLDNLTITGWAVPPHYNAATHNLEWGLKIQSSNGGGVVNYTTRHLGRGGFISTILVTSLETLQGDLAEFRKADASLTFSPGSTYQEFREGDKVAGYGIAALIAGGAGAAAVKSGAAKGIIAGLLLALKGFAKAIIALIILLLLSMKNFFVRLFKGGGVEE